MRYIRSVLCVVYGLCTEVLLRVTRDVKVKTAVRNITRPETRFDEYVRDCQERYGVIGTKMIFDDLDCRMAIPSAGNP